MTINEENSRQVRQVQDAARLIRQNASRVIVGKEAVVDLLMVALLCEGHILFEDVPGIGKTTLAKTLARSLGCSFQRIQFTPDLLPSDITGITFYNQKNGAFEFRPGPLLAQIVLADEINRATPRTQSALLEAMEERQISIEGAKRLLYHDHLLLSPHKILSSWKGRFHYLKHNLIVSCCAYAWIIPAMRKSV